MPASTKLLETSSTSISLRAEESHATVGIPFSILCFLRQVNADIIIITITVIIM